MAKKTMKQFLDERWNFHRQNMTHTPTTDRTSCACCGDMVRGEPSPWAHAALEDWYATPYMQRSFAERNREITYRAIKFGCIGRRRTVIDTRN